MKIKIEEKKLILMLILHTINIVLKTVIDHIKVTIVDPKVEN